MSSARRRSRGGALRVRVRHRHEGEEGQVVPGPDGRAEVRASGSGSRRRARGRRRSSTTATRWWAVGGSRADSVALVVLGCRVGRADAGSITAGLPPGFRAAAPGEPADWVVVSTCSVTSDAAASSRQAVRRAAREHPRARILVAGCHAGAGGDAARAPPRGRRPGGAGGPPIASRGSSRSCGRGCSAGEAVAEARRLAPEWDRAAATREGRRPAGPQDPGRMRRPVRLLRGSGRPGGVPLAPAGRVPRPDRRPRPRRAPRWCSPASTWAAWGRDLRPRRRARRSRPRRGGDDAPSIASGSPRSSRWSSRSGSSARRPAPSSASTSTSRCRAGRTGCSRRCAAPTAPPRTPASSRRWPGHARARPSAPTSWSGFPGETEDDHRATLALLDSLPLAYLHVFAFSPRPGTPAAAMEGRVPRQAVEDRLRELRERSARRWTRIPGRPARARAGGGGGAHPGRRVQRDLPASTPRSASRPVGPGGARRWQLRPGEPGVRLGSRVARAAASS